jgi:hypothetical protein
VQEELLYSLDLWLILLGSIIFLLAATEMGFRLGRRARSGVDQVSRSEISTIQGAMLGLLALILGFTFAMAMNRFEARKQVVLEESNAIGTTFLRAQMLPKPPRQEISDQLRRYVDAKLAFDAAGIDRKRLRQAGEETDRLQRQLWSQATALGEKDPRSIITGLFIQSLNEMIDLHAKGITALENHVPEIIIVLLYFVAIMAIGLIGYGCGLGGQRNFFVTLMASILIAAVIMVIIDLDRPRRGLIKVSQQRMLDLKDSLAKY